jgi:hyperosmotically inducible periplasmic protein
MNRSKYWTIRALTLATAAALAACGSTPTRESTGEVLDDSVITTKVKTALLTEKEIDSTAISVETFKGRVLLSGYVKGPDQRQRAEGLTRGVPGVKAVNNKLELK